MKRDYIEVDPDDFPYSVDVELSDTLYTLAFQYNDLSENITVDLLDSDGNPIVLGEFVVLDVPLWYHSTDPRLPGETIIPMDETGHEERVTMDNLNRTVFLAIDDISDDDLGDDDDGE